MSAVQPGMAGATTPPTLPPSPRQAVASCLSLGEGAEATDLIEELRQWGVPPNFPKLDDQFSKALLLSAFTAHKEVMQALLATKAVDLNAAAGCGFTALQLAAMGDVIGACKCAVGPTS